MKFAYLIAMAVGLMPALELEAAAIEGSGSILDGEWEVTVRKEIPKEKEGGGAEGVEESKETAVPESETTLRIRAQVVGFGKEGIRIRPAISPETVLEFQTSQLIAVNRLDPRTEETVKQPAEKPEEPKEPEDKELSHTVTLIDGGEFSGKIRSLDKTVAVLESEQFGSISIPMEAVSTIAREGDKGRDFEDSDFAQTTVYLDTGEIFKGDLGTDVEAPNVLTVRGMLTQAEFKFSAVERIEFPSRNASAKSEEERIEFEIGLSKGGRMTCSQVDLNNGFLSMAMRSGVNIRIPVEQVGSIYPIQTGGGISGNGVLLWGGYSDPDEEYDHTRKAVEAGGFRMSEIKTGLPGSDFRRQLFRSQAFVIPEMEKLNAGTLNSEVDYNGRKMKLRDYFANVMRQDLERYWATGGHVICTGIQGNHFEFLKLLGVGEVKAATDKAGDTFKVPADIKRRLRLEIDTLKSANATHAYDTPEGWEKLVEQEGKNASAVISKRMRRGRITLIGADFYETNSSIDEMLQKTIRMR